MLDTNTVSAILRELPGVRERLLSVPMTRLCISAVTEGEMRFGVARKPKATRLAQAVEAFLLRVDILAWDSAAARRYAILRAGLEAAGTPLGNLDTLIAAHALAVGARLVTSDAAFARVPGLACEDWTRP